MIDAQAEEWVLDDCDMWQGDLPGASSVKPAANKTLQFASRSAAWTSKLTRLSLNLLDWSWRVEVVSKSND